MSFSDKEEREGITVLKQYQGMLLLNPEGVNFLHKIVETKQNYM